MRRGSGRLDQYTDQKIFGATTPTRFRINRSRQPAVERGRRWVRARLTGYSRGRPKPDRELPRYSLKQLLACRLLLL